MRPLIGAALLVLVAGALFFSGLGAYPLLDPDEARHAEVAREMAAGDGVRALLLPTLELKPYREKPAGFYWLVTLAYAVLGVCETAARLPSAIAALVTVLAVYAWAVPRHGVPGALGAALVLATSAGWVGLARFVNVDMTLTTCVAVGVLAGLAWLERPAGRRAPLAPWIAAGLGMLVKGPIALLLTIGPLALAWTLTRPRPRLGALRLIAGLTTTAAIAGLLYVPVALLDASYVRHFAETNVARLGAGAPHDSPLWYYVVWLPALLLPWTFFAPPTLARAARDPTRRALLAWAVFVPLVLTLARGKLATYALSALVPLALLVGPPLAAAAAGEVDAGTARALRVAGWIGCMLLAAGAIGSVVAARFFPIGPAATIAVATAMAAAAGALAWTTRRRRAGLVPVAAVAAMLVLYPVLVHLVAPAVARVQSDRDAASLIAGAGPAPVLAFSALAPSLVFYLRSPLVWTEDPNLVRDLFARDEPVFLVTGRRHFGDIEALLGERAHVWHATRRRRLYANRPPPARRRLALRT
jgi:4-amino-4-deoxy-L-arabinose transferase-like glycosyltransferase